MDEAKSAAWKGCYVCEQCGTRSHYGEFFILYVFGAQYNLCVPRSGSVTEIEVLRNLRRKSD